MGAYLVCSFSLLIRHVELREKSCGDFQRWKLARTSCALLDGGSASAFAEIFSNRYSSHLQVDRILRTPNKLSDKDENSPLLQPLKGHFAVCVIRSMSSKWLWMRDLFRRAVCTE